MTIDQIDLQDIYEFMEKGSVDNAPPEIVLYLELLDKVRGMLLRIDQFTNDEAIVKHLILVDGLSRYKAKKMIDEAREYFYNSKIVSKDAWRNIIAEQMQKVINFAMLTMKDVSDADRITKMLQRLAYIRRLDKEDEPELPEELFKAPFKIYSLDARISEFAVPADRNKLAKLIDALPELTEKEKARVKEEALVLPLTIFPDEQANPRKS